MTTNQEPGEDPGRRSPLWVFIGPDARTLQRPAKVVAKVDRSSSGDQRNAPCPCGSGRKYKFCHGQHRRRFLRRRT